MSSPPSPHDPLPQMEKHRRSAFWQREAAEKAAAEENERRKQEEWKRHSNHELPESAFTFTPLKESSGNRVEIADPPASTLKRQARNANYNTLQPTKPSLKFEVRPERAEQSRTWGKGGPRGTQGRSASVMNGSMTMGRPVSRSGEQHVIPRYQSYCTLPRPDDPLDAESLMAAQMAAQQSSNVFYVPFQTYQMAPPPPSAATLPRQPPPPQMSIPISMPPPPPPEFRPPVQFISQQPVLETYRLQETYNRSNLIPWDSISMLSYMHGLFSICIFSAGGYRIVQGAKWAVGVEMVYAILVLINAFLGFFAVQRRSVHAAVSAFVLSGYNLLLAILPIVLGLMPWFAENGHSLNPKWFISETEPFVVDYCLALLVAVEAFICGFSVSFGCRSLGNLYFSVDELKDNIDTRPAKS